MTVRASDFQALFRFVPRRAAAGALLALIVSPTLMLSGCADVGDTISVAFADPAKYDLYDCKQLEPERKSLANHLAELEGLMAKAQTGTAGPVVAELAYRNDYISTQGQAHFAEEAWRRNKCHETPTVAAAPPSPTPPVAHAKHARHSSRSTTSTKPAPTSTSGSAAN
jgi:hypothetical protein